MQWQASALAVPSSLDVPSTASLAEAVGQARQDAGQAAGQGRGQLSVVRRPLFVDGRRGNGLDPAVGPADGGTFGGIQYVAHRGDKRPIVQ